MDSKSLSAAIYFDTKKGLHRLKTLAQSPELTSKVNLGDHLKERLRNAKSQIKVNRRTSL